MHKLNHKIVKFELVNIEDIQEEVIHESIGRPEHLEGQTYKIKPANSEHALYITINHMVLNKGLGTEKRVPYEVFINSKNMDNFQWVLALTRLVSAVFRKGGETAFLVDELKNIFDPKGGYYKKGGVYMPSLVAEIGCAIEKHMLSIGYIVPEIDAATEKYLEDKKAQLGIEGDDFPPQSQLCPKCNTKALIIMDGCLTCLNCGDSKCG